MVASPGTNHFVARIVTGQWTRCGEVVDNYSVHAEKKKTALKIVLTPYQTPVALQFQLTLISSYKFFQLEKIV